MYPLLQFVDVSLARWFEKSILEKEQNKSYRVIQKYAETTMFKIGE